jgi:four helix bundle protein
MEDLRILQAAEVIADEVWKHVTTWQYFPRNIVGGQLARSADSVGANIAEAFGRYHYGDKLRHLYIARGSLFETKYWLNRCEQRGFIAPDVTAGYSLRLTSLARQVNGFAANLRAQQRSGSQSTQGRALREGPAEYAADDLDAEPLFSEIDLAMLQAPFSNLQSQVANAKLP